MPSKSHREVKEYDVKEYVNALKNPQFNFSPAGKWNKCYGDNKSIQDGAFTAMTQTTTDEEPKYRVMVKNNKLNYAAVGPIVVKASEDGSPPSNLDVVNALRRDCDFDSM